jgi:DegV family protein with EDD domain
MAVAIVTDSAAALPRELAELHSIVVVPMWLTIGGRPVRDTEASLDEILVRDDVTTSGPSPGEFKSVLEQLDRRDGVCVCTIASTMSSTYESAVLGARAAGGNVRVVDTTTAAGAQALVVLAAAGVAARGGSLDEVERAARAAIAQVSLVAMVPTLDHLVRSGRVPNIAGWAGRRLGLAPLFEFRDGGAKPLRPARGADAALERIIGRWHRSVVPGARLHVAALHAQAPDDAQRLLRAVEAEVRPDTAFVGEFGSVMLVHTGPGLVGLAWRWEPTS